jgi:hypothetical protein
MKKKKKKKKKNIAGWNLSGLWPILALRNPPPWQAIIKGMPGNRCQKKSRGIIVKNKWKRKSSSDTQAIV